MCGSIEDVVKITVDPIIEPSVDDDHLVESFYRTIRIQTNNGVIELELEAERKEDLDVVINKEKDE